MIFNAFNIHAFIKTYSLSPFFLKDPYIPLCRYLLHFSHFLRKTVNVINVSILYVNITKLSFVCICITFDFPYFKTN